MMTNVLLGDYPDVFQAGDAVRNAFPGYTGPRPRMQLWHGTADEVLNFVNFGEEIKQWTNVLG